MLFNSYVFILILLPLSIVGYYLINRIGKSKLGLLYLLGISLWFIGYMNIKYLLVLIPSLLINYLIAYWMNHESQLGNFALRRLLMTAGVCFDVVTLLVFKYCNFFIDTVNDAFGSDIVAVKMIMPLGISFYTFQQITYLVDSYRDSETRYSFLDYSLYICFFPQFVQGPIMLQNELIPQFLDNSRKTVNYESMAKGIYRFVLGLAKKVLIADTLGLIVDGGYERISELNSISAIVLVLSYTLQIYFDFSGYSDMAIGIGWMFNIDIAENFDSPYKAVSIEEFWDRWHITLTRFFTRYVYIPLGGSRKGWARTYANVFFIFLLSGLWHGAEWSFVLWGVLHGIAMLIKRIMRQIKIELPKMLETVITFIFVNLAWVLFRADNTKDALHVIRQIFAGGFDRIIPIMCENFENTVEVGILCRLDVVGLNSAYPGIIVILFVIAITVICFTCKNTRERMNGDGKANNIWQPSRIDTILIILIGVWSIISFSGITNYIYWNF